MPSVGVLLGFFNYAILINYCYYYLLMIIVVIGNSISISIIITTIIIKIFRTRIPIPFHVFSLFSRGFCGFCHSTRRQTAERKALQAKIADLKRQRKKLPKKKKKDDKKEQMFVFFAFVLLRKTWKFVVFDIEIHNCVKIQFAF